MINDDNDLRKAFHGLRDEDATRVPPFDVHPPRLARGDNIARRILAIAASVIAVVGALAVGMVWGTNTGYATGRNEGASQRAAIAASARGATNSLAALRFELARTRARLADRRAGAVDAELQAIEASIERIEMDLEPRNASSIPLQTTSRNIPMNRALALTCAALGMVAQPAKSQEKSGTPQGIPIVDLPAARIQASSTFGGPMGVRELSNGKVMINDGRSRQIKLFDSTLTTFTMVGDSMPGGSNYYGPWGTQLLHYTGDTSVFADFPSQTLLVLNPVGDVTRVIAPPGNRSIGNALISARSAGFDPQGRLILLGDRGTGMMKSYDAATGMSRLRITSPPDSIPVLRADFAARRLDTLGRVMRAWIGGKLESMPRPDGKGDMERATFNPLLEVDEFATLSDGTLAIVRGHDYHVDWIAPDGTKSSTGKLPFDWKRITEEEKLRLIDSTKNALDVDAHNARALAALSAPPPDAGSPGGGGRGARGGGGASGNGGGGRGGGGIFAVVSPSEMPDFYPPIHMDAALADRDGNLWVLPSTSAQSKQGELVYDVINPKRGLFERVRLPLGRSIVGFGPKGVVYLMSGNNVIGFKVEKTRLK